MCVGFSVLSDTLGLVLSHGFVIPTPAGVVAEKGSEYILAHTGPRELDGHSLRGCGSGLWSSSRLYYPSVRLGYTSLT